MVWYVQVSKFGFVQGIDQQRRRNYNEPVWTQHVVGRKSKEED
jgi:hypothetical protein